MMKFNVMSWLIVLLLIGVLVLEYQQYQHARQQTVVVQAQLASINKRLSLLDERVSAAETEVGRLDQSAVENLVKEANGAIIDGWQALINTVDEELQRVRRALKPPPDRQPPAAPQ